MPRFHFEACILIIIMQKLFENWRNYQKEVLKEQFTTDALGYQAQGYTLDKLKASKADSAKLLGIMRTIASIGDPTGVLSWPEFKDASAKFEETRTMRAGGEWLLALLAVIPVLGKATTPAKLAKLKNITAVAVDSSKMLSRATDGAEMANNIQRTAQKVNRGLDKARKNVAKAKSASRRAPTPPPLPAAAKVAKIAGLNAAKTKTGRRFGVFVDDEGRAFVNLVDETGETVTFVYSSGTSYHMVGAGGELAPSPSVWYPVKHYGPTSSGRQTIYHKFLPNESPKFGGGDPELWSKLREMDDEAFDMMHDQFGAGWIKQVRDPEAEYLRATVDNLIDNGAWHRPGPYIRKNFGKYPAPNSMYGKLGKKLKQLSPNGKVDELVDYFGPVVHGTADEYNTWRKVGGGK